jgi:hypothetical protein
MSRVTRLVSLALATMLAVAPAVTATCAALCAQVPHHAAQAVPAAAPQVVDAGHHHDDHGAAPASPRAAAENAAMTADPGVTRENAPMVGAGRPCCDEDDAPARPARALAAGRGDSIAPLVANDAAASEVNTDASGAVAWRSAAARAPVPIQGRSISVLRI